MLIERQHPFTGEINRRDINVTLAQLREWQNGKLAQDAFPHLTPDEREFIMTGLLPEDWDELFP